MIIIVDILRCANLTCIWCICTGWFDFCRCCFLPAHTPSPSRGLQAFHHGLRQLAVQLQLSVSAPELARSPEQALTQGCNHGGAAGRVRSIAEYTSTEHYLPEFRLRKSAHGGAKNESTPSQDTTQYVAHKHGSVPANRLRHSTNTERFFFILPGL